MSQASNFTFRKTQTGNTVIQNAYLSSSGPSVFDREPQEASVSNSSSNPFRSGNVVQDAHPLPIHPSNSNDDSFPETVVKEEVEQSNVAQQFNSYSIFAEASPTTPMTRPFYRQVQAKDTVGNVAAESPFQQSDCEMDPMLHLVASETAVKEECEQSSPVNQSLATASSGYSVFDHSQLQIPNSPASPFRSGNVVLESTFQQIDHEMDSNHLFAPEIVMKLESGQWIRFAGSRKMDPIRPTESMPEPVVKEEVEESSRVEQAPSPSFPPDAPLDQDDSYVFQDVKPKVVDSDMSCIGISAIDLMKDSDMEEDTQEEVDDEEDHSDTGEHLDAKGKANTSKSSSSKKKLPFCVVCQKVFYDASGLWNHQRIHTGEKPYQCDVCQKRFLLKRKLTYHLRVHTGEKPYSCEVCQKCFSSATSLTRHMRVHTGERPYSCETCGSRFKLKNAFDYHVLTHTGEKPYDCDVCKKSFRARTLLKRHMRTHTGEKPYECKDCEEKFGHLKTFKEHRIRCHP